MTGFRKNTGGLIDRSSLLPFRFDGKNYVGFEGDTLASALLANGVQVLGRSFKYHRARGVWGAWFDDPNAIFDVRLGEDVIPNCLATTTPLVAGMEACAVNAWPNASFDIKGGLDLFHRWLSAGFYYKTFMSPNWHLFEPTIRKMAGLGRVDKKVIEAYQSDQLHDRCDVLVVGGGASGLIAARTAAENGKSVTLVEDHPILGGGVFRRALPINSKSPSEWVDEQSNAIRLAGGRILTSTTAYGIYDHQLAALVQDHGFAKAPTLHRMRFGLLTMATGATDRPITFENNDLPGIMAVESATEYLARYGVLVSKRIAIASNNSFMDNSAALLEEAGANIQKIDLKRGEIQAKGRKVLSSVAQGTSRWEVDVLLASSGWTPLVHLWRHAGGKLVWSDTHSAFLPGKPPQGMIAVGAANGTFDFNQAIEEALTVGADKTWTPQPQKYSIVPHGPATVGRGRQWIDLQHDVTLKDIKQAAQENYVSVEHLKRYTTLGMATDQGKTSNMSGLAAMATIQGKSIPEIGTTTFRPPFVPVPLTLYHGHTTGQLFSPLKRLELEKDWRAVGAAMGEYGGWLRPGWFGEKPAIDAVRDEVLMARNSVSLMDASPLGKIEVMGQDAEAFVNFIFYNTMKTLKKGHIRYGFMLTEGGIIYDDGVVSRLGKTRFVISCSSSHVEGVLLKLESWRQDGNNPDRIFVHDSTPHWSTLTLSGPKARQVLNDLHLDIDASAEAFPHMTLREIHWRNTPLRIARVSFSGDVSYEISISSKHVDSLWAVLMNLVKLTGGGPIGLEASSIMRAEKGYIIVGKDTDGDTMPQDLGFTIPRQRKTAAFVGDRGLHTDKANDKNRKSLVGLQVEYGDAMIPTGAHIISEDSSPRSLGFVTSSYESPTLNRPIALAQLERGHERTGQFVKLRHLDQLITAKVVPACTFDPNGDLLHAE